MTVVTPQPHTDAAEAFVPDQSRAERRTSFEVSDFTVPNGREEEWRFTPVDRLADLMQVEPGDEGALLVETQAPEGVELLDLPLTDERVGTAFVPADRAAASGWAGTASALYVGIPKEAELAEPVVVRLKGDARKRGNGHTVIDAGRHSRATVVLSHTGSAQHLGNVEVRVGDGAELTFVTVQEWDDDAIHVAQNDALVGRDASLKHIAVTLGGEVVRVSTNVRYAGPGGSVEALGVYFADAHQHQEHRLFVDHEPAHCVSRVEYKGALQGESAHTLETETGEIVGAGHASATGRFDDEQLFYLQARGIREDEARRLVVRGFFADIVQRIGVPEVQQHLMAAIDAELSVSMGEQAEAVTA